MKMNNQHNKSECPENIKKLDMLIKNNNIDVYKKINNNHTFNPSSTFTPYILLMALSLHSFFEAIALGVISSFNNGIFLFIAILCHKWAESLALGISFYKSGTDKSTFIKMICLFASVAPLGIVIGIIFSGINKIVEASFLALSGGTFLYVSCSEVIVEEFAISKNVMIKYTFYLIAATLALVLKWYEVK